MTCDVAQALLFDRALESGRDVSDAGPAPQALTDHVGGCAACTAVAHEIDRLVASLGAALVSVGAAPTALRERLLFGTRSGRALPTFASGIAKLLDLDEARARAELSALEAEAAWGPGLVPGNRLRPIRPGASPGQSPRRSPTPRTAWFLKTTPGVTLPRHRHQGSELTFVLQGGFRDSAGTTVWAGEQVIMADATEHDVLVLGDVDCIALVVSDGGIVVA
jgi:hypothetical protein